MAKLSGNNDVRQTYTDKIKLDWKNDLCMLHEKYFKGDDAPTSWEIGEDLGYCKGTTVLKHKEFTALSWSIKAIRRAMDKFERIVAQRKEPLSQREIVNILDIEYDRLVDEIAIQWTSTGKNNK